MKNLSESYLKSVFQRKFKNFEAEPSSDSWERLEKTLSGNNTAAPAKNDTIGFLMDTSLLVLVLAGLFFFTGDDKNLKQESTSAVNALIAREEKTAVEMKKQNSDGKGHTSIKDQRSKEIHKGLTLYKNVAEHSSSPQNQEGIDTVRELINIENLFVQENKDSPDSTVNLTDSLIVLNTIRNVLPVPTDTVEERKSASKIVSGLQLIIKPFYNTVTFVPIQADNVQIKEFNQSSNILQNRIGASVSLAYVHDLSQKFKLEYSLGYRLIIKRFQYTYFIVDSERVISEENKSVKGVIHSCFIDVKLKSSFFSQLMFISAGYDRLIGDKFNSYLSPHVIYYGVGFERNIGLKMTFRPSVQIGVPVGHDFRHFKMRPMNIGVEFARKIGK